MPQPTLNTTHAQQLDLNTYYTEFTTNFTASNTFWKLERGQHFAEPSRASWRAFNHGNWHHSMQLLDQHQHDIATIHQRNTTAGTTVHRIRITQHPLTPYMRWELEALHRRNLITGGIRVLDAQHLTHLEPDTELPDLNITDNVAYHVIYDHHGVLSHVWKHNDTTTITTWRDLTQQLWNQGTPIDTYYNEHLKNLPPPNPDHPLPDDYLERHGRPPQPLS